MMNILPVVDVMAIDQPCTMNPPWPNPVQAAVLYVQTDVLNIAVFDFSDDVDVTFMVSFFFFLKDDDQVVGKTADSR